MINTRRRKPNDGLGKIEDGDVLEFGLQFMDEVQRAVATSGTVHDGRGEPAGHRPGFCFSNDTALAQRATDAYEERNKHLADAWRRDGVTTDDKRPTNLKDAQDAAALAYEERSARLRNGWRERTP